MTLQFYAHAAGSLRRALTPAAPGGRGADTWERSPPPLRPGPGTASFSAWFGKLGLRPLSSSVPLEF